MSEAGQKRPPRPFNANAFMWHMRTYCEGAGISKAYLYRLLDQGVIESVMVGTNRMITTPPAVFVARLKAKEEANAPIDVLNQLTAE